MPAARDRGFATEAMTALVELSFARGWQRVVACTDGGHGPAARVAQKAGLRIVAVDETAHGLGWTWMLVNPSWPRT
ncbi:GNAT family protein [Piscinibacter sp. XHJ-5]|uniref:GNAT family N-acetyltransferase n=1 Tax=Piscinibacter sp. XHJ-5 TaxID=3037797 RepID=UPI0024530DCE|nr:GNAT family protein [Piscinibacter sp. XHJ-5]